MIKLFGNPRFQFILVSLLSIWLFIRYSNIKWINSVLLDEKNYFELKNIEKGKQIDSLENLLLSTEKKGNECSYFVEILKQKDINLYHEISREIK